MSKKSYAKLSPEKAAERIIDDLNIKNIKDLRFLDEIAYARGAIVVDKALSGMEARLTVAGSQAIITISTKVQNQHRRRFSIAHELGHLELHSLESSFSICLNSDINDGQALEISSLRENEANSFSSSLLLPKRFVSQMCQKEEPSLDFIAHLGNEFDTSLTATGLRYVDFCEEPIALVYSQGQRIKWFKGSRDFNELGLFVSVKSRLDPSTLASRFYKNEAIPNKFRRVNMSAWIDTDRYRSSCTVLEQSWSMPNYGAVLTLLWVDDDISEDNDFWEYDR